MFIVVVDGMHGPAAAYHGFTSREEAKEWATEWMQGFKWVVLQSIPKE